MGRALWLPLNQTVGIVNDLNRMFVLILCCTNVQNLRSRARWQWRAVVNRYRGIVRLKMSAGRPPSEFWIKLRYGRDGLWPVQLSHGHRRGTKFMYNWIRTAEWGQRPVWCVAVSAVVNTIWSLYEYCTTLYQLKRLNGFEWVKHRQTCFLTFLTILYELTGEWIYLRYLRHHPVQWVPGLSRG